MRILQVTEYFWPQTGGAPIADAHLAAALVAAGHEVTVITDLGAMDLPAEGEYRGVMVRRFGVRRALSAGGSPAELSISCARSTASRATSSPTCSTPR
jgi:hypothetical protein